MYILFKRNGARRLFKKYAQLEEMNAEINLGHNEKFPGNNQFHYDMQNKVVHILNPRLSMSDCQEQLLASACVEAEVSEGRIATMSR